MTAPAVRPAVAGWAWTSVTNTRRWLFDMRRPHPDVDRPAILLDGTAAQVAARVRDAVSVAVEHWNLDFGDHWTAADFVDDITARVLAALGIHLEGATDG
jgi:hypothetical protein